MGQSTLCICDHTERSHPRGGPCRYCAWCRGFKSKGEASPAIEGQAEAGLWRIALDTSHFSFEAYGATLAQANRAFDALIDAHVIQTGADPDWAASAKRDAVPYEVHAGVGIRDHDVIVKEIA